MYILLTKRDNKVQTCIFTHSRDEFPHAKLPDPQQAHGGHTISAWNTGRDPGFNGAETEISSSQCPPCCPKGTLE